MVERQPLLFSDNVGRSGVLTDSEIEDAVDRNWLISKDTFQQSALEASSYDIHVGEKGILGGGGVELDLRKNVMELCPGAYGGVISRECVTLPENMCARIGSKRALSYEGVILLTGSIVDPGYEGYLLFGLYNASQRKVYIRFNKKICNIVFERLSRPADKTAPSDPNLKVGNFPDAFLTPDSKYGSAALDADQRESKAN
jgi:deoxycytidine triphosphate deaminase